MSSSWRSPFLIFYLVYTITRGVAQLLLPLYFLSVGISLLGAGLAVGVYGVGLLVFEVLWGVVLDRVGPRWLIFGTIIGTTGSYFALPFVTTLGGAFAIEFIIGASAPIMTLVARSNVVREGESGSWAGGFGLLGSTYSVAQLVGYLLGTLIAPTVGLTYGFYLAGFVCVAVYVNYLRLAPRQQPHQTPQPKRQEPVKETMKEPVKEPVNEPRPRLDWRGLPLLCLVAVPAFIAFSFLTNYYQAPLIKPPISASKFESGIAVSMFWLSTAIFQPVIARKAAGNTRKWIGVAMLGGFGVFALMTQLYNIWEIAGAVFLAGICFSTISPLSLSILMVGIPRRYAGTAIGVYGSAEDIGVILGPVLGSAALVEFGLPAAYLTLGVTFLLVLVPYAIAMRSFASKPNR